MRDLRGRSAASCGATATAECSTTPRNTLALPRCRRPARSAPRIEDGEALEALRAARGLEAWAAAISRGIPPGPAPLESTAPRSLLAIAGALLTRRGQPVCRPLPAPGQKTPRSARRFIERSNPVLLGHGTLEHPIDLLVGSITARLAGMSRRQRLVSRALCTACCRVR